MKLEQIQKLFVGTWKGTDNGSYIPGEVNSWIVTRKSDETFVIKFTTFYSNGEVDNTEEIGTWRIEDNTYIELREDLSEDTYFFNFVTPNSIHFIDASESDPNPYNFIDYRILLD
nr:hypothetical protein [uncultured Flavobacterium sp.]